LKEFSLTLGTNNAKKRKELERLLAPYPIKLRSLADIPNSIEVEETGTTFEENAILKAREQALHLNCWVLGEDSGISVEALDGAPGVYSARFSGPDATDAVGKTKRCSGSQKDGVVHLPHGAVGSRRQHPHQLPRPLLRTNFTQGNWLGWIWL